MAKADDLKNAGVELLSELAAQAVACGLVKDTDEFRRNIAAVLLPDIEKDMRALAHFPSKRPAVPGQRFSWRGRMIGPSPVAGKKTIARWLTRDGRLFTSTEAEDTCLTFLAE